MNEPQTVTLAGTEYAVVPLAEYNALRDAAHEDVADDEVMDAAVMRRVLDDPDQEWVPADLVRRIAAGENAVRVWREYRGMKAGEFAAAAGIVGSYLSAIENGKKPGSIKALKAIAGALDVTIEDLV